MLTWSYFAYNRKNMGQYGSETLKRHRRGASTKQHFY